MTVSTSWCRAVGRPITTSSVRQELVAGGRTTTGIQQKHAVGDLCPVFGFDKADALQNLQIG